ncbi:MAG: hypothetical protein OXU75_05025 [Deltaproteobacteria bacterium]|nr:hypothetical protein [Deltaproteobacteria bacterium]
MRFNGRVCPFEFKVVEWSPPGSVMAQLQTKGYETAIGTSHAIHLVAFEFSRQTRNVTGFKVADAG